jgi:biopolymer transport protein ExbD
MKIVIAVLALLIFIRLFFWIRKRDGAFRKNVKPRVYLLAIIGVVAAILICSYLSVKQLTIMLNVTEQLPFLKEGSYEKNEETSEADANTLVIEISTQGITVAGKSFGSYEEAKDKITEKAMKYDRVLLVDNYADNETYQQVKSLILSVGIQEGNIQEKQEP